MPRRLSQATTKGSGRQGLLLIAALTAAACGVVALVFAILSQRSAPEPIPRIGVRGAEISMSTSARRRRTTAPGTASSTRPSPTTTPAGRRARLSRSTPSSRTPLSLPESSPAFIDIPAIGVHSSVIALGRDSDGALAVPQPGPNLNKVAWYDGSSTPGETGPSVLEGHIDSVYGPSVFFRLGAVRPGNKVEVTRADGSTAIFTVNAVRSYATHSDFPTQQVFGSDLAYPTLRLITCSNFDHSTGHYAGNTVVYAHLTAVHPKPRSTSRSQPPRSPR